MFKSKRQEKELSKWLENNIEEHCNMKDPKTLNRYIMALIKKEDTLNHDKQGDYIDKLEPFMRQGKNGAEKFVSILFDELRYIVRTASPSEVQNNSASKSMNQHNSGSRRSQQSGAGRGRGRVKERGRGRHNNADRRERSRSPETNTLDDNSRRRRHYRDHRKRPRSTSETERTPEYKRPRIQQQQQDDTPHVNNDNTTSYPIPTSTQQPRLRQPHRVFDNSGEYDPEEALYTRQQQQRSSAYPPPSVTGSQPLYPDDSYAAAASSSSSPAPPPPSSSPQPQPYTVPSVPYQQPPSQPPPPPLPQQHQPHPHPQQQHHLPHSRHGAVRRHYPHQQDTESITLVGNPASSASSGASSNGVSGGDPSLRGGGSGGSGGGGRERGRGGAGGRGRGRGGPRRPRHGGRGGGGTGGGSNGGDTLSDTVVVTKIPPGTVALVSKLKEHFGKFGLVRDVTVVGGGRKAFVQFSDVREAQVAKNSPEAVMGNRFIDVHFSRPREPSSKPAEEKGQDQDQEKEKTEPSTADGSGGVELSPAEMQAKREDALKNIMKLSKQKNEMIETQIKKYGELVSMLQHASPETRGKMAKQMKKLHNSIQRLIKQQKKSVRSASSFAPGKGSQQADSSSAENLEDLKKRLADNIRTRNRLMSSQADTLKIMSLPEHVNDENSLRDYLNLTEESQFTDLTFQDHNIVFIEFSNHATAQKAYTHIEEQGAKVSWHWTGKEDDESLEDGDEVEVEVVNPEGPSYQFEDDEDEDKETSWKR